MNSRSVIIGALAALLLAGMAGGAWWYAQPPAEEPEVRAPPQAAEAEEAPLPLPPVPPRIAQSDDYDRCLSMLVSDPEGAQALAQTWQTAGGGEAAEHCLALARVALGDAEEGAAMLEKIAASSKRSAASRATLYHQAAVAWLMIATPQRAFDAGSQALKLDPDDTDLLVDHAIAAGGIEHWQDAVDDLTHALEADPRRSDAMVLRAAAWRHLGHDELAQDDVDRALTADPENAEALLERGILRQRRGDAAGARTDWEKAIELAPDSATADLAEQNIALLDAGPGRP